MLFVRLGAMCSLFYDLFKILFGMLAQGAGKIVGQAFCLNLIAADLATPYGLACGLFLLGLRLDVCVVISIGRGGGFG